MENFNNFLAKHGISDYYNPDPLVMGKTLNYKKDCLCEFGEYVQADTYDEPRNDMQERSKDVIYLRPNDNTQGGHIVMYLKTGEEITRGRVTPVPLTDTIKEIIEGMAISQGIENIKFTNKKGGILAHHDWITGVDYDAINDPTKNEDIENNTKEQIEEIFGAVEQTNPRVGTIDQNVKNL